MHRDHHAVLEHPIAVRLAVGRRLLEVHVGEPEAVEEDHGGRGVRHALAAIDLAALSLQLADACAGPYGGYQHFRDPRGRVGEALRSAGGLALHHPGLAAVPAIKIDGAVTVE